MKILQLLLISLSLIIPSLSLAGDDKKKKKISWEYTPISPDSIYKVHNQIRASERQRPLKVSKDLTKIAQIWANELAKSCKMRHRPNNNVMGENIYWSSAKTNIAKAVNYWAAEKQNYNFKTRKCKPGKQCYHYTQVVWKNTTDVGCAKQRCGNGGEIYVCNYFPMGNVNGGNPY